MRKILTTAIGFIVTAYLSTAHWLNAHPNWKYTLIALSCFLALALVIFILKKILHVIHNSLISTLFILTTTIILVVLAHEKALPLIVGVLAGIVAGFLLAVSLIRNVGKWAQTSVMFGEVFSFITSYKIKSYIEKDRIIPAEDKIDLEKERGDLIAILTNMDYTKKEAKERADYAMNELPDATMEDKLKRALKYNEN